MMKVMHPAVVTIPERKARAVARLVLAAAMAKAELAAYAHAHDGRFVLFGSFARGDIRPDSDMDIVVAFDAGSEREARDAAEDICRRHGLRSDVFLRSEVTDGLLKRIARDGVELG